MFESTLVCVFEVEQADITVKQKYCLGIAYRFAKGNIISDGKGGITIGEPHDQGLVFKWGSLIGIEMPTTGASGTLPFVSGNVEFTPAGFTGTITDDWATVPFCNDDFGNYDNPATDHLSSVHNPTTGIGDICRYMGEVDGATWRMPTAAEWAELYGSATTNSGQSAKLGTGWTVGNYYPLSGRAFGPRQAGVTIDESHGITSPQVTNANPYINGAVFLPTNGFRHIDGVIYHIGLWVDYWASTTSNTTEGYCISFTSTGVTPQWSGPRTYGFSVRCIRE